MIIYDMAQSWRIFFASLVIGGALGVLYDILRLSRLFLTIPARVADSSGPRCLFRMTDKTSPENDDISASTVTKAVVKADSVIVTIVAFVEDILFFTAAACVVAVFVFNANTGVSRGYLLIGAAAGFAAYLATVGRLTWLLGGAVVDAIRRLVRLIIGLFRLIWKRLILPPARFTAGIAKRFARFIYCGLRKIYMALIGRKIEKKREQKRLRLERERLEKLGNERREREAAAAAERSARMAKRLERARMLGISYSCNAKVPSEYTKP